MSINIDRGWMYKRVNTNGSINPLFNVEVERFLDFAFANEQPIQPRGIDEGVPLFIRCPCKKCELLKYKDREEVRLHLLRKGFMISYTHWFGPPSQRCSGTASFGKDTTWFTRQRVDTFLLTYESN